MGCVVVAAVCLWVWLAWSAERSGPPPQVTVESGRLEGRLEGGIRVFRGIPYAAAPVGALRWRAPRPPLRWTGVRKAHAYGNDSPHLLQFLPGQDEDCLFLNVWAPEPRAAPYPVMVWIHGGGLVVGSGRLSPEALVRRGVVVVSFNYRLGRLGSFAHPSLAAACPRGEAPANFWLLDQIAALKWVRANISAFGGDRSRVTVFGVSAGGSSVNLLLASPLARGLFQRAIAQSCVGGLGPFRRLRHDHQGRKSLLSVGTQYAHGMGIDDGPDAASALRGLPWRTVAKLGSRVQEREGFEAVVDGESLTDDVETVFASGRQNRVPFIAGSNSFEGDLSRVLPWVDQPPRAQVAARLDRLAPLYGRRADDPMLWDELYGDVFFRTSALNLVQQTAKSGTPAWNYYFDYVRQSNRNRSRGAGHGSEGAYVFDILVLPGAEDRAMARSMQGHWVRFAETGDPNGPGLPNWPRYSGAEPVTLVYSAGGIRAETSLHAEQHGILREAMREAWPAP